MDIRPLTPTEQKYTYAQSMQLEGQTGTIGHLRGDFATTGYGFYTTWFDTRPQWKSDEFKPGHRQAGGPAGPQQHRDHPHLPGDLWRRTPADAGPAGTDLLITEFAFRHK